MESLKATPRQLYVYIEDCIRAGLVPYVRSSPGMGKSSIMHKLCSSYALWLMDHRLSTSTPEDLSGLPKFRTIGTGENAREIATFVPFDMFPIEGTPIPKGHNGWMVFLDEFNSGSKAVQAAAYKLILDKMVGQHKLHERTVLTAAGNLDTDRAITNALSTAMQSRVVHLELTLSYIEWLEDVALSEGYDNRIISYIGYDNSKLMDFRADHNDKTFCCPRTWEFMNRLIKVDGHEVSPKKLPLYSGTITSGAAADFVTFCEIYEKLPHYKDIINNPTTMNIPQDRQIMWATIGHLMENLTEDTLNQVSEYISRMTSDYQILFYRGLMVRKPELRSHEAFRKAMVNLSRHFNDSPYLRA